MSLKAHQQGLGEVGRAEASPEDARWRELGACRGLEPSTFYPDEADEALKAKAVCGGCIVRIACLEFALQTREKNGVWGGLTERERRIIIRKRSRKR